MNIEQLVTKINRDYDLLAPILVERVTIALNNCHNAGYPLQVFEGWRSPLRQQKLYTLNRAEAGTFTTDAKAWQSWHQYGLAVDVAYFIKDWTWKGDFEKPSIFFLEQDFVRNKKEAGHYQLNAGLKISEAQDIVLKYGLQALWLEVEASL